MDVYRALWRRRFIILALTLATVVTTFVVVSAQTKQYKSTALIRVKQQVSDPTQVGNAIGVAQHLAQIYAQIVVTGAIADSIEKVLHGRVPRDQIRLSAQPVNDLELLYVSGKSSNPRWAADVANAAPVALRRWINASSPKSQRDQIQVVNPAGVSSVPVSPRVKTSLIIAFLAGLVFNGALAIAIEFLSDRIRGVEDLEALTPTPVLATVPLLVFGTTRPAALDATLARARALTADGNLTPEPKRPSG
jgi:capsular polysaccharide biosynthesis protein